MFCMKTTSKITINECLNKHLLFPLILLVINIGCSYSQHIQFEKFGDVSIEELTMKTYEKDTTAEAIILYQSSEFLPFSLQYKQYQRIKILKQSGIDNGNLIFWGRLKSKLKGFTYNLENGKVTKTNLRKDAIFEERVAENIYRTRIAMPNVKEGSVIEVSFILEGLPFNIEIQKHIPVVYSIVSLPKAPLVNFGVRVNGMLGAIFQNENTWVFRDLPAFKPEPFMMSEMDYRVVFEIDAKVIQIPGQPSSIHPSASSWNMVTTMFNNSPFFGRKINAPNLYINDLADSLKTNPVNDEDLIRNAFEAIKIIKWNGIETCFLSQELKKSYELRSGNVADINLNLLVLLRKLGFKVYPVLFSTRGNGKISFYNPTVYKFNYVIVGVDLSDKTLYLDASDEFTPMGLIPSKILGCLGHPLDENRLECSVFLSPVEKDKMSSQTLLFVSSTGSIAGTVTSHREGYNAIEFKREIKSKTSFESYIHELETFNISWSIDNFSFSNINNPYEVFISEYNISNSQASSDIIYIDPFAFVKSSKNPFLNDQRTYPISFPYEVEHKSLVTINVPENFRLTVLPSSNEFSNRDKTVFFSYTIYQNENIVTISTSFTINTLDFYAAEFNGIKTVFDLMMKKMDEKIVIEKLKKTQ